MGKGVQYIAIALITCIQVNVDAAIAGRIPAVGSIYFLAVLILIHSSALGIDIGLVEVDVTADTQLAKNYGSLYACGLLLIQSGNVGLAVRNHIAIAGIEVDTSCCRLCLLRSCLLNLLLSGILTSLIDGLSLGFSQGVGKDTILCDVVLGEAIEAILEGFLGTESIHLGRGVGRGSQRVQNEVGILHGDAVDACNGLNADTVFRREISLLYINFGVIFQFNGHLTIFNGRYILYLRRADVYGISPREALYATFILGVHCVGCRCILLALLCRIRPGSLGRCHLICKSLQHIIVALRSLVPGGVCINEGCSRHFSQNLIGLDHSNLPVGQLPTFHHIGQSIGVLPCSCGIHALGHKSLGDLGHILLGKRSADLIEESAHGIGTGVLIYPASELVCHSISREGLAKLSQSCSGDISSLKCLALGVSIHLTLNNATALHDTCGQCTQQTGVQRLCREESDFLIRTQHQVAEHRSQHFLQVFFRELREHLAAELTGSPKQCVIDIAQEAFDSLIGELTAQFADTAHQISEDSFRCTNQVGIASGLVLAIAKIQCLLIGITGSRSAHQRCTYNLTGHGVDYTHEHRGQDRGSHIRCGCDGIVTHLTQRGTAHPVRQLSAGICQILSDHARSHLGSSLRDVVILRVEQVLHAGLKLIETGSHTECQLQEGLILHVIVHTGGLTKTQGLLDAVQILLSSFLAILGIVVVVDSNLILGHVVIALFLKGRLSITAIGAVGSVFLLDLITDAVLVVDVLVGQVIVLHAILTSQLSPQVIGLRADIAAVLLEVSIACSTGQGNALLNVLRLVQVGFLLTDERVQFFHRTILADIILIARGDVLELCLRIGFRIVDSSNILGANSIEINVGALKILDFLPACIQVEVLLLLILLLLCHISIVLFPSFPLRVILSGVIGIGLGIRKRFHHRVNVGNSIAVAAILLTPVICLGKQTGEAVNAGFVRIFIIPVTGAALNILDEVKAGLSPSLQGTACLCFPVFLKRIPERGTRASTPGRTGSGLLGSSRSRCLGGSRLGALRFPVFLEPIFECHIVPP